MGNKIFQYFSVIYLQKQNKHSIVAASKHICNC